MLETVLKGKLHRMVATESDVEYEGSIDIGMDLMEAAGIRPYERVLCINFTNGNRWWTYAVPTDVGHVRLNGGSARQGIVGDVITVFAFAQVEPGEEHHPKLVMVGDGNTVREVRTA